MSINYGFSLPAYAPLSGSVGKPHPTVGALLQEDGSLILQEDGFKILFSQMLYVGQEDGSLILQENGSKILI